MSAAAQLKPTEYSLLVSSGPDKGTSFHLSSDKIVLGRSPQNDVCLSSDPKISRKHIVIDLNGNEPKVTNISGNNFMLIDGEKCKTAHLKNGSLITVGSTQLVFTIKDREHSKAISVPSFDSPKEAPYQKPSSPKVAPPPFLAQDHSKTTNFRPSQPRPKSTKQTSGRLRFYAITGIVFALLFWLISSPKKTEEDPLKIRNSQEVLEAQEASRKRTQAILQNINEQGKDSVQYDEAQASYIRCFRDFQQGQYTRAIQHCQAALSIFPNHQLAERYLLLSQRKREERMQFLIRKGKLYFERGYYTRCMSTLSQVMYDLKSPSYPLFQEAKQLHAECKALQEGSY